jgi:uncharacterized protein (TIGR02646 family)
MYCEDSAAAHIDHFCPRSVEPRSTFSWTNYLLACSICNSNFKRDRYPLDGSGEPLLLDPTNDDPRDHLVLSPSTGRYEVVAGSAKGTASISVFGLNRELLERARRDAWDILQALMRAYGEAVDEGDSERASKVEGAARRLPCKGVLLALIAVLEDPEVGLVDQRTRDIYASHPAISEWRE